MAAPSIRLTSAMLPITMPASASRLSSEGGDIGVATESGCFSGRCEGEGVSEEIDVTTD